MRSRTRRQIAAASGGSSATSPASRAAPAPPHDLGTVRLAVLFTLFALLIVDVLLESFAWPRTLWGANAYGFLPRLALIALALPAFAFTPLAARSLAALDRVLPRPMPRATPWLLAAAFAGLFWVFRERHRFWGDGQALVIDLANGMRFHPDEPLTIYVHHLLLRLGSGHWRPETAVAVGSVLAGFVFVAWLAWWCRRRFADRVTAMLAVLAILAQGSTQLFRGHVENYSYFAVALLLFFTLGLDVLAARRWLLWALLAGALAYAFHQLGGVLVVPALVLAACAIASPAARRSAVLACVLAVALVLVGASLAARLYPGSSPFAEFATAATRVLTNPVDFHLATLVSWRQAGNVWGEWMISGPLSVVTLAALALTLPGGLGVRSPEGAFLLAGCAAFQLPFLLTGEGNLGAARNWDLFAATALVPALWSVLAIAERLTAPAARRLLLVVACVSIFQTAGWALLNTDVSRTMSRIAALPLPNGNGPMMLGTYYLNAGNLKLAEDWFRRSLAIDPENPNSQSGLGLALARQGRLDDAEGPMDAAVRLKPATPSYRYDLIALEVARHRCDEAIPHLVAASRLVPGERRTWFSLADCWLQLGHPERSSAALEEALTRIPDDPDIPRALAIADERWIESALARGDRVTAELAFQRMESRLPEAPEVAVWRRRLNDPSFARAGSR